MTKESKILRVVCYDYRTLNLIPYSAIKDDPIKCKKCGKILVERKQNTSSKSKTRLL